MLQAKVPVGIKQTLAFSAALLLPLIAMGQTEDLSVQDTAQEEAQVVPADPVAEPLSAINEASLLPILMDFARSDLPETQKRALLKAQELKHPFLLPHVRYLARLGQPEVRIVACETLAIYQNVAGLEELKLAITDSHLPLAIRATELLAKFPLPAIRTSLVGVINNQDAKFEVRQAAVLSLRQMATPQARLALDELRTQLPEELSALAARPFDASLTPEPKKILVMRRLFTADYLEGRLQAIAMVTEAFSSPEAKDILSTCLKDPEKTLQIEALHQAAQLEATELETLLRESLDTIQIHLVLPWLELTKSLDSKRTIPILLSATSTSYPRSLREGVLERLSEPGPARESNEATSTIIQLFEDSATDPARQAIAQALSVRPADNAFLPLYQTLGRKGADENLRRLALSTLIKRQPANLRAELMKFARTEPSLNIRQQAAAELVQNHCEELGEVCREFNYHYPTEQASALYLATAGAMGASSLGLLSYAAGGNQPYIAALSGAVLSSGTAYLLAPEDGVTIPEAFHFTSLGLWGTALGYGIGATAVDGLDKPAFAWSLLGGQILGATLGAASFNETSVTSSELGLMHWSGIEATSSALGAMLLWGNENPTEYQKQMGPAISSLVGLGLGVAPMWFLADDLEFSDTDTALVVLSTLGGGLLGSMAASGTSESKDAGAGGFLLGQGLGYLSSMVASQYVELTPGQLSWLSISTSAGAGIGTGIYMVTHRQEDDSIGLAGFIGALTLTAASSLSSEYFDLSLKDADMALVGSLLGASLGVSIPLMTGDDDVDIGGSAIIGASSGLLGGLIYDHLVDVSWTDSSLTLVATMAGGFLGGGLALMLPDTKEQTAGALLSTLTLAGFTTMAWAAPRMKFEEGDTLLVFGSMALGSFVGGTVPGLIYGDQDDDIQTVGGTLAGTALGLASGLALSQFSDHGKLDVAEGLLMASMGSVLGHGIGTLAGPNHTSIRSRRLLSLAGTAAGMTAGFMLANHTTYSPEDYWLTSYLGMYGAFQGAWLPELGSGSDTASQASSTTIGGAMVGSVLGVTSGILLSQYASFEFADINEMALGSIASSLFGAGIGLMVPTDNADNSRPWVAGMQIAGVLGTAAVGIMAPHTDFSEGDTALGFLATAYTAWQGAGASLLLGGTDRQVAGAVLATTALGAAGGAAISQYVDATTAELFAAFSGSVWGAWIGGMGSVALQQDFDVDLSETQLLGSFFVASDLGLIATAIAMSPLVEMDPERIGWINLYGLSGMAVGSALAAIVPDIPFWTTNVSASALGLIAGAIATSFIDMPTLIDDTPALADLSLEAEAQTASFRYPGEIVMVLPQFQITPITSPNGQIMAHGNRFVIGLMGLWN